MRCIAGQSIRNFGNKDIVKLAELKPSQQRSDATTTKTFFVLHADFQLLYSRDPVINKLRGIITFAKYGSFTGSVISKNENPVMLGHDDNETMHVSYDSRKFFFFFSCKT